MRQPPAIVRTLASVGRDPHRLASVFECGAAVTEHSHRDNTLSWKQAFTSDASAIWFCFHRRELLSLRNAQFVDGLKHSRTRLSDKQRDWLCYVLAKLDCEEAA